MRKTVVIFPDTEFTDFANMDMISIGAVVEHSDDEFYAEVSDHREYLRSGFVQVHVMCHTDMAKYGKPKKEVAEDFANWVDSLDAEEALFVVDYVGDWQLIHDLFQIKSPGKKFRVVMYNAYMGDRLVAAIGKDTVTDYLDCWNDLCAIMAKYFVEVDNRQHHALVDARANKHAFVQALKNAKDR